MIEEIKKFVKNVWTYLWSKTTVDEKVIAKAEEIKTKAKKIKEVIKG